MGRVPLSLLVAAICGFAVLIYLIVASGAADVAHALLSIGWWLLPITLFHLVPLFLSALSWRELLPVPIRPHLFAILWIRWIRESINALLPVAAIGGDIAGVRLTRMRGVPGAQAAASIVVDVTVGAATQMIVVIAAVAMLPMRSSGQSVGIVAGGVLIGTGILSAGIGAFVVSQHRGVFAGAVRLAQRVLPGDWLSELPGEAAAIDGAVVAAYRDGRVMLRANALRLIGWISGAGEVWLVMYALGQPLGMLDSFILESLGSGVRAAAFMVPGALGAQEGGYLVLGALFGLPADTALALSLCKRARELALGLPGLFVWHGIEGHSLLRRTMRAHPDRPG